MPKRYRHLAYPQTISHPKKERNKRNNEDNEIKEAHTHSISP
jgi:hypothetical protein